VAPRFDLAERSPNDNRSCLPVAEASEQVISRWLSGRAQIFHSESEEALVQGRLALLLSPTTLRGAVTSGHAKDVGSLWTEFDPTGRAGARTITFAWALTDVEDVVSTKSLWIRSAQVQSAPLLLELFSVTAASDRFNPRYFGYRTETERFAGRLREVVQQLKEEGCDGS
jgi:hypothetical protein